MEFVANESKKVEIETSTGVYQRHAIQTHFVQIGENYIDLIERYVKPLYEEGDLLSISEKVIALCQKRVVYRKDIHPGFWAKLLCRFVHVTPAGPGAGTPHKMQLIIMICGLPRVLLAAFCSAVTKLFGKKGVFYKVCGHEVDGIDGLIDYDISFKEYVDYGILNPENPSGVCDEIYEKTGVKAMITVSPSPTAVTTPSALTLATAGLLLIQVSTGAVWPAAFAVSRWLAPMDCSSIALLLTVTRPISDVTVTVHRSTCPAVVNALTTALPEPTAVTVPLLLTVATAGLLEAQLWTCTRESFTR